MQWKAQGREELEWERTSHILAMLHNCNAEKPKQPRDFNPFYADDEREQFDPNADAMAIIERETRGQ